MTLIIALACTDGVVFASDSQDTFETSGGTSVRTNTDKIKRLGEWNLWAASGDVSIIQKIESSFKCLKEKSPSWFNEPECRQLILKNVLDIRKQELERHRTLYGEGKDKDEDADESDLLIVGCNDRPLIWYIDEDAADECFQEEGHYEAIGSGDVFALTLLKRYITLFKKHEIKLSIVKGSLLVYRVLSDSIDVGAEGIGYPVVVWTVDNKNTKPTKLEEDKLKIRRSNWLEKEADIFRSNDF